MKALLSRMMIGALLVSGAAQASMVRVEEVPEPQPELAARLAREAAGAQSLSLPSNLEAASISGPEITAGLIIIDQIVNLGQALWNIVIKGRPVANIQQNVADAVPKGITSWEQLQGWNNPVTKLYHTNIVSGAGMVASDFYFRVLFTPGGNFNGAGKYLTGVTIMPADLTLTYNHNLTMTTNVVEIVNHGTQAQPVAGMTLQLKWSVDTLFTHNEQAISFHVRGDGGIEVLASPSDRATSVNAPSTVPPIQIPQLPGADQIDDPIGPG